MLIVGIPLGFYGYLFPGTINIMLMDIYIRKKIKQLVLVLAIALAFEAIYCVTSIKLISLLSENSHYGDILRVASCALLFFFGAWMIIDFKRNIADNRNNIRRGLLSIIIHPQQLLFWLVFSHIIDRYTPLFNNNTSILLLALYNCIGTLIVFYFYMLLGPEIIRFFKLNIRRLNALVGIAYVILAIFNTLSFLNN